MAVKLKAADVMTPHVIVAHPNMSVMDAGKLMNRFRIGGLPVVNKKGELLSIITERCIMKNVIVKNRKPGRHKVRDVMVRGEIITGAPGESVGSIAEKMHRHDKTRIPVVDKGKLVGIVTNKDIIESAPALIDLIVEQAAMTNAFESERSLSFGSCEKCGRASDLYYKENNFMCEECAGIDKMRQQSTFIKKLFGR